jgi:CcmD family protein
MKKTFCFLIVLMVSQLITLAQDTSTKVFQPIDKAIDASAIELLKRDGKIYTVVAVLSIILVGIFFYLWRMDKKITRLEK